MSPYLAGKLAGLLLPLAAVVFSATCCLIGIAFIRRRQREEHSSRLDDVREQYRPIITALLAGSREYRHVVSELKGIKGPWRLHMLERLCFEHPPAPAHVPLLRRLCEDLGLVQLWQRDLTCVSRVPLRQWLSAPGEAAERAGRLAFLVRARSAENLRLICHQPSWTLLVKALEDPHADVRAAATRALAAIGAPESFPVLVERLHLVVLGAGAGLSVRSIKAALVSFPLHFALHLRPSLSHPHPRVRFLATDVIREMVERQAFGKKDFVLEEEGFPKTLREVFLAQLWRDTNPDVRARAATVIGSLEDPRAALALLNLIEDPQWFVRLHGVRALSKPRHTPLAAQIACRLTDSNWRVREAVAQTLVSLGQFHLLVEHLACGDDRYANEQIAEELERDGFMSKLLAHYALTAEARERKVVERLARMDKTSYIVAMLQNGAPPGMRERFLVDFGQHPDPQVRSWAARVAQTAALEVAAAVD